MKKFGVVKSKLLTKLTESYAQQNKAEIKELLTTINENKEFKEMYLFYESIENKFFDDNEVAKLFVEEVGSILKSKNNTLSEFTKTLDKKLGDVQVNENELYNYLDTLSEGDSLNNIDKKVIAKRKLVEHLTKKKSVQESEAKVYSQNENLLHAVLANNFNVLYNNTLSEEEKRNLKEILSFSNDELTLKTNELKESLTQKLDSLLTETQDSEMKQKLEMTKEEVNKKEVSRLSYYRLTELKNGLN
jgi:hypothetical protein